MASNGRYARLFTLQAAGYARLAGPAEDLARPDAVR
jgi:hypothetical protein